MKDLPNIILVIMDATRYDHLSCYGYHRNTSPFIDSIAENSVLYKQAISLAPWTLPSIASLFTGMFPSKHKTDRPNPYLTGDFATLAELLRDNGYESIAITDGSWISAYTNFNRGFNHFIELWQLFQDSSNVASYRMVKSYSEEGFALGHLVKTLRNGNFVKNTINAFYGRYLYKRYDYGARRINKLVSKWIETQYNNEKPLFLYVHYMEPHLEYKPPRDYRDLFLEKGDNPSKVNQNAWDYICQKVEMDEEDFRILKALYDAEIRYQDFRIKEMYENLDRRLDIDNTMFIITADHGENIGEHGLMDHQYSLHDTLIHVPLIIKFPKGEFEAVSVGEQVQTYDIFYSILERIGKNPKDYDQLDAESLIPPRTRKDRLTFSEYLHPQPKAEIIKVLYPNFDYKTIDRKLKSIRTGRNKYILVSNGKEELYDLVCDPAEERNIANQNPNLCAKLRSLLIENLGNFEKAIVEDLDINDEMRRRLEDLGYI